jgi:toxin CcdB
VADVLIRQFDVYRNPNTRRSKEFPFVVVLQSDWVSETSSVIVAPLIATEANRPARLHPACVIDGETLVLAISDMAAIPRATLANPVGNLAPERDRIISALDLLFTGY